MAFHESSYPIDCNLLGWLKSSLVFVEETEIQFLYVMPVLMYLTGFWYIQYMYILAISQVDFQLLGA